MRTYTLFRIKEGQAYYVPKGFEMPAKEFEAMFPLPMNVKVEKLNGATCNVDGSKSWLHDD
jgi:hypothetical protein